MQQLYLLDDFEAPLPLVFRYTLHQLRERARVMHRNHIRILTFAEGSMSFAAALVRSLRQMVLQEHWEEEWTVVATEFRTQQEWMRAGVNSNVDKIQMQHETVHGDWNGQPMNIPDEHGRQDYDLVVLKFLRISGQNIEGHGISQSEQATSERELHRTFFERVRDIHQLETVAGLVLVGVKDMNMKADRYIRRFNHGINLHAHAAPRAHGFMPICTFPFINNPEHDDFVYEHVTNNQNAEDALNGSEIWWVFRQGHSPDQVIVLDHDCRNRYSVKFDVSVDGSKNIHAECATLRGHYHLSPQLRIARRDILARTAVENLNHVEELRMITAFLMAYQINARDVDVAPADRGIVERFNVLRHDLNQAFIDDHNL